MRDTAHVQTHESFLMFAASDAVYQTPLRYKISCIHIFHFNANEKSFNLIKVSLNKYNYCWLLYCPLFIELVSAGFVGTHLDPDLVVEHQLWGAKCQGEYYHWLINKSAIKLHISHSKKTSHAGSQGTALGRSKLWNSESRRELLISRWKLQCQPQCTREVEESNMDITSEEKYPRSGNHF